MQIAVVKLLKAGSDESWVILGNFHGRQRRCGKARINFESALFLMFYLTVAANTHKPKISHISADELSCTHNAS